MNDKQAESAINDLRRSLGLPPLATKEEDGTPSPQKDGPVADSQANILAETPRQRAYRLEMERLHKGGADYRGMEAWRGFRRG